MRGRSGFNKPSRAKQDAGQKAIVKALRAKGAYVHIGGPLDLLVAYRGLWYVLEVKDGAKIYSKRKLTKDEIIFILEVKNRAPIHLVESVEQALEVLEGAE